VKDVILHDEAQKEMEEAASWYEEKRIGLGDDFLDMVDKTFVEIARTPGAFGFFSNTEFRKRSTKRFPYLIIYREREDDIWVVAVAHTKRKPRYWLNRTKP